MTIPFLHNRTNVKSYPRDWTSSSLYKLQKLFSGMECSTGQDMYVYSKDAFTGRVVTPLLIWQKVSSSKGGTRKLVGPTVAETTQISSPHQLQKITHPGQSWKDICKHINISCAVPQENFLFLRTHTTAFKYDDSRLYCNHHT